MAIKKIINIGRSVESDYRIDSEAISNQHALLIISDRGKFLLVDCASTNGTRLLSQSGAELKLITPLDEIEKLVASLLGS